MFGIETLSGSAYAAANVGLVLVEAIVLYGAYGVLTRVAGPSIENAIQGR